MFNEQAHASQIMAVRDERVDDVMEVCIDAIIQASMLCSGVRVCVCLGVCYALYQYAVRSTLSNKQLISNQITM